ncbi:MAG: hypothetical protein IPJ77_03560 [Planctomycetes bacterium]|nr:hypothetical protein [Planctomycetota bacterium]
MSVVDEFRARIERHGVVLADQALVSGTSFVTTVLLVRALGLDGFGRFSLAWMAVVFAQALQLAFVGTPMATLGPKEEGERAQAYHADVLRLELAFLAAALALGLAVGVPAARALGAGLSVPELGAVAFLALARCAHDFVRQRAYVLEARGLALRIDVSAAAVQLLLLALLGFGGRLDPASALGALGVGSLAGVVAGLPDTATWRAAPGAVRRAALRHAGMSRWLVALAVLQWFTSNAFALAAGAVLGPAALGALRAGQTVMGVLHVGLLALENVVPVRAAWIAARSSFAAASAYLVRVAWIGGACTLAASVGVGLAAAPLARLCYGAESPDTVLAIRGFALLYVFAFLVSVVTIRLRTQERTRPVFVAQALGAGFALLAARSTVETFGLAGALAGIVLQQALVLLVLALAARLAREGQAAVRPAAGGAP